MLVVLSFYFWTAATSAGLPPFPLGKGRYSDYYNLLLHGILKGHLYLDVPVDPEMLRSANPYDPKVWIPHGWMMDSSFYHGHYYIYYGWVPLLVFMLPFRLLTGGDLWLGTAGEIAVTSAFLGLVWLWLRIRRDYFPRSGSAILFASVLALGFATGLLSLARRPLMYEFAIGSGCFFAILMLHSLYSVLSSERKAAWMAMAGVFLGLAVGCRPTLLFAILAPVWALFNLMRKERPLVTSWWRAGSTIRSTLGFALGFGMLFSGTLLYNYLRFSNVFDFGYNYLLQDPVCDLKHIWSLSYFWFNLRNYYWGSLEWTRYFPFATTGAFPKLPQHYYGVWDIFGILKYAPIVWFSLVAPLALRKRSVSSLELFGFTLGIVSLAYLGPGFCELCFGNAALRYVVDFLPALVLLSILGACALDDALLLPWAKRAVRMACLATAVFSAAVAAILSVPLEGTMTVQRGNAYIEHVARVMNIPTSLYESARGWGYGPITWQVTFPDRPPNTVETLVESPNAALLVEYLSASRIRFGLRSAVDDYVSWGAEIDTPRARASVLSTSFGSLYPTSEHPYYLEHEVRAIRQSAIYVGLDGRPVLQALRPLNSMDSRKIYFADGKPRPGWFSGNVVSVARSEIPIDDLTPDTAPRTLRMSVPGKWKPGRWPLISAGTPDAGQMLFLETGDGQTARFGYFSSGSPLSYGPAIQLVPRTALECTVEMEPLNASGGFPGPPRPLLVEMDGKINWMSYVAYHPCRPDTIRIGANTVSAPLTEGAFPGNIQWVETPTRRQPSDPDDRLLMRVVFPSQTRWGLREPLLSTGIPGSFDEIGVVHYGEGLGRFFLDHNGSLNQEGPIIDSVGGDSIHDLEIITPVFSLYRGSRNPARGTTIVRMDGQEVLRFDSDFFPAQLGEANVGGNEFGGPIEKRFVGALLTQRWVAESTR